MKDAARQGDLYVAVFARDATENARDRVLPLLKAVGVPVVTCETAAALGRAVGRERLVVVGLKDPGFAGRVRGALPPDGAEEQRN